MDGHGASPRGRCEGIPDPNEVFTLGKLSVFSISYDLITLDSISADLDRLSFEAGLHFAVRSVKFSFNFCVKFE